MLFQWLILVWLFGLETGINLLSKHIGEKVENKLRLAKTRLGISIGWCFVCIIGFTQEIGNHIWLTFLWLFFGIFNTIQLGNEIKKFNDLKEQEWQ